MENNFETIEKDFLKESIHATDGKCFVHDNLKDDNTLILQNDSYIIIITGCAHRGIINIINYAIKLKTNYIKTAGIIINCLSAS